jgi:hypothetical protein
MENVMNPNRSQESAILELASGIANFNLKEEWKSSVNSATGNEIFPKQQYGSGSLQHIPGELASSIEAILHCFYKDAFRSYEEVKKEDNCDDEQLLSYHIFNEVSFVAKNMFPGVKFM